MSGARLNATKTVVVERLSAVAATFSTSSSSSATKRPHRMESPPATVTIHETTNASVSPDGRCGAT